MASLGYLNGVNISMVVYIIMCILVGYFGGRYFFSKGQSIAGFLFLIGALTIFIIYGKRWFDPNGIYNTGTVTWPPMINTCPDFLTAYTDPDHNIAGCVDTIGVSRNHAFQKLPANGHPQVQSSYPVNNGIVTATLTNFFPINVSGESDQGLCDRLGAYGLTWDGVFDGDNCAATVQPST